MLTKNATLGAILLATNRATSIHQYRLGIQLLAQTMVRPSEILSASWEDIDLKAGVWRVDHGKRRKKTAFPERKLQLPKQAITTLQSLRKLKEAREELLGSAINNPWLIPSHTHDKAPATTDALGKVLRRAANMVRETGFPACDARLYSLRQIAFNWVQEQTDRPSAARRLAGAPLERNEVTLSRFDPEYNLPLQADLLQRWADYLDECMRTTPYGSQQ